MLSVVVLNKDRLNYLALKLQCLKYQVNFSDLDVLVVDFSESDEVAIHCELQGIRCVRVDEEFNLSLARNIGIRNARNEWVCISGNDTIIDRLYFSKLCGLIKACENRKVLLSGSFAHFVRRDQSLFNEKLMNGAWWARDRFGIGQSGAEHNRWQALLLSASIPWEDFDGGRWSLSNAIRKLGELPFSGYLVAQALSANLLAHLLQHSTRDDQCLQRFHDHVFSAEYLKKKELKHYSFQTLTKTMAQELNGYDETFQGWGAEDDDFIMRAEQLGYEHVRTGLVCYHLEHRQNKGRDRREKRANLTAMNTRQKIDQPSWGQGRDKAAS